MEKENMIGNTIKVVGWIIFAAGLIAGFVVGVDISFITAMMVWVASLVTGAILLGISEVIKLLQKLVDQKGSSA